MIKKESSHSRTHKNNTTSINSLPQHAPLNASENMSLNRYEFLNWTKKLALQQRYVALRLRMPEMVNSYRGLQIRYLGSIKSEYGELRKPIFKNFKVLEEPYQAFLDSLVFMTDEEYLDCIGFDYSCVQNPERLYDLLKTIEKASKRKIEEKSTSLQKKFQEGENLTSNKYTSREQWVIQAALQIERALIIKLKETWSSKIFEEEKNNKKYFVAFWKSMDERDREFFLRLNSPDSKALQCKLSSNGISLRLQQLDHQVDQILKADKKQLCNRIFKWKAKKNNPYLCNYYETIFNNWKDQYRQQRYKKRGQGKNKSKKGKRNKSIDAMSNQTNQTQIKQAKIQVDIKGIAAEKLQRDILNYSDNISDVANSYFQRRVLAFQRLKYLLEPYGIYIKLYGSCAAGIAIQNSDLDVAVDQKILQYFAYASTPQKQIQQALNYIHQILYTVGFTSEIKLINSAYIPIIKFKIDTSAQFYSQQPYLYSHLNRKINSSGSVQVDLTIQTTSQPSQSYSSSGKAPVHLGLKSTAQICQWLQCYPTLRPILLVLKYQLTLNKLNETYNQGLNTYSLVVMLVAAMKHFDLKNQQRIGLAMEKVLRFYCQEFNQKQTGIELEGDQIFYIKNTKENSNICADLEVKDPLNNGKNMTRNCYRFMQIRQIFVKIYNTCIIRTHEKVQQVCSLWNPKKQKMYPEDLSQWVLEELKDSQFDNLFT